MARSSYRGRVTGPGRNAAHAREFLGEKRHAELLPYVHRARYVGRYGWVTAEVEDEESLEAALEWMRESYWLKAPPHLRSAVEET